MLGCFQTAPACGCISPVSSLISVDLPAPFACEQGCNTHCVENDDEDDGDDDWGWRDTPETTACKRRVQQCPSNMRRAREVACAALRALQVAAASV